MQFLQITVECYSWVLRRKMANWVQRQRVAAVVLLKELHRMSDITLKGNSFKASTLMPHPVISACAFFMQSHVRSCKESQDVFCWRPQRCVDPCLFCCSVTTRAGLAISCCTRIWMLNKQHVKIKLGNKRTCAFLPAAWWCKILNCYEFCFLNSNYI
jgi:hypothetical protein